MSKDWDAVAAAINTRLDELDMTQAELAAQSRVSPATLRQIQHAIPKARSPRTLSAISEALGWPSRHLEHLAAGHPAPSSNDRVTQLENTVAALTERVQRIEDTTSINQ